jgi:hypothetical protein
MGRLRHVHTDEEIVLVPRHLVGRGPACQLRLDEPKLSNVHAELIWDGIGWKVRDLGSRNGTFVAGARIEPGSLIDLEPGVELAFAGAQACFRLVDATPPRLVAISDAGQVIVADDETLFIPAEGTPELTIYRDREGRWLVESSSDVRHLDEHELLAVDGGTWQIHLPTRPADTRTVDSELRLHGLELRFLVSRDEEHIELGLRDGPDVHKVEPRAHLALLLTLARLRLADHQTGLPGSECGWVHRDDLAKMLAIDPTLANLWIHRARKQLMALGVRDSALVVERRAAGTQVRLGVERIVVEQS